MSEICTTCGLPKELCVCETIAKETLTINIYTIKKKFGKKYTVIEGVNDKDVNIKDLTKKLKNTFACGGTAKGGTIELQGAHTQRTKEVLVGMGFSPSSIKVKQ